MTRPTHLPIDSLDVWSSPGGFRLGVDASLRRLVGSSVEEVRDALGSDAVRAFERRGFFEAGILTLADRAEATVSDPDYGEPIELTAAEKAAGSPLVRVCVIGTCMTQFAERSVHEKALAQGYDFVLVHRWFTKRAIEEESLDEFDVVVFQPGASALLNPLFREDDSQRRATYARKLSARMAAWVGALADRMSQASLLLVHNIAQPSSWPVHGSRRGWTELWADLNSGLEDGIDSRQNTRLVDERAMAYQWGSRNLFDDRLYPWSHHGGKSDPEHDRPHQFRQLSELLGAAYLDLYVADKSPQIKLIACDLDNTLWPGVIAEDAFGWLDTDTTTRWKHLGIQEALRSLERSGIVLVSLSKGDSDVTLGEWSKRARELELQPSDFASHYISWAEKSEMMLEILDDHQTTPDRVLFIDDNPVELHRMKSVFPAMNFLGPSVNSVRSDLLDHPQLQAARSSDRQSRTKSTEVAATRRRRARETGVAPSPAELGVTSSIRIARDEDGARVQELVSRTTQFALSGPFDVKRAFAERGRASIVLLLEVSDKYVDYGIAGMAALDIDNNRLDAFSLSCRVLGLGVEDELLDEVFRRAKSTLLEVNYRSTDRNHVIKGHLQSWGMELSENGWQIERKTNAVEHVSG